MGGQGPVPSTGFCPHFGLARNGAVKGNFEFTPHPFCTAETPPLTLQKTPPWRRPCDSVARPMDRHTQPHTRPHLRENRRQDSQKGRTSAHGGHEGDKNASTDHRGDRRPPILQREGKLLSTTSPNGAPLAAKSPGRRTRAPHTRGHIYRPKKTQKRTEPPETKTLFFFTPNELRPIPGHPNDRKAIFFGKPKNVSG